MALLTSVGRFSRRPLGVALVVLGGALLAACGSTAVTSTGPTLVKCSLALKAGDSAISPAGGTAEVILTTTPECTWTASTDASWLARVEPASGQGNGTLRVDVSPNPSPSMRQAAIIVNGVRAQIQQGPAACEYAVSGFGAQTMGAGAGSFLVTVTATTGCAWVATSPVSWLRVTSGSPGTGSGVVEISVAANAEGERVAELTIAGQPFVVTQVAAGTPGTPPGPEPPGTPPPGFPVEPTPPGCSYVLSPPTLTVPATGGSGPALSLTTTCAWSAAANVPWITITSANGSGNATIGFTVAPNNGAARSGTIFVGSSTTTINQASGCSVTLNPTTVGAGVSGGSGSVGVSSDASCSWTAISGAPWITITSGAAGSGNGSVVYSVAANGGGARSGTIHVGSATATINQDACSFSLNPDTIAAAVSGRTGSIGVSSAPSCGWTAVSNAPWITITSPGPGAGNGTVGYSVAANGGAARTGTISVGTARTTINQEACSFGLNPSTIDTGVPASSGVITVSSAPSCGWTPASDAPWITVTSAGPGSGNGTVGYSVAANTGAGRSGTITIGTSRATINQAACTYSVSPTAINTGSNTIDIEIEVITVRVSCSWTASSNVPWITVSSGAAGAGNGTAAFTIQANPGPLRSGTLIVAGQTVTVTQSAP